MTSIPDRIGRYKILEEIGRGGFAVVYKAKDTQLGRSVAVKIAQASLHSDTLRARFHREAKTVAALDHPAIVPLYDFGEIDRRPYLIMRYMEGRSLRERLSPDGLPPREAARILNRLAPALDEAHAQGIIHRDLKPANILFDRRNVPHIGDFGIVKLEQATTDLTAEGIVGTPAYMSPEQVQGDGTPDGRSDIYALGVVVFEMLTGRVPYTADTPTQVMMKHVLEPVPDIREVRADLPPAFQAFIWRAMAKDREDRFQTVSEMADALTGIVQGDNANDALATVPETSRPGRARQPSPSAERTQDEDGRSWLPWAIGGLVVLCLLAVLGIGAGYWFFGGEDGNQLATRSVTGTAVAALTETAGAPGAVAATQTPTMEPTTTPRPGTSSTTTPSATATTVPPTPTPSPTPSSTPPPPQPPQRISFATGETSATIPGRVEPGQIERYVLRALGGQEMFVDVSAPGEVLLSISGANGTVLKQSAVGGPTWYGALPSTQDYTITIIGRDAATDYSLFVEIAPLPDEDVTPTRIRFEPGAISATIEGTLPTGGIDRYVLRALAGQTMQIDVTSTAPGAVTITVRDEADTFLGSAAGDAGLTVDLPTNQDYTITLTTPLAAPDVDYTMTVTVE